MPPNHTAEVASTTGTRQSPLRIANAAVLELLRLGTCVAAEFMLGSCRRFCATWLQLNVPRSQRGRREPGRGHLRTGYSYIGALHGIRAVMQHIRIILISKKTVFDGCCTRTDLQAACAACFR